AYQQTVPEKYLALGSHIPFAGEHHPVPPDLNDVIDAGAKGAPIHALHKTPYGRQGVILFFCLRTPDKVHAFQIGKAAMHHIVPDIPQAVWGHGRQKGNSADPLIKLAMRRQALMAGIMPDNEKATYH